VCCNRIVFGDSSPAEAIATLIEFARLVDMCNITGLDSLMANHIKQIILADKTVYNTVFATPPDQNTYHLMLEHIKAGVLLPEGHYVRKMLASTAVKDILFVINVNVSFSRISKGCRILRSIS